MSNEIRIAITVRLPDDAIGKTAPGKTVFLAWEAFTLAIKDCDVVLNDLYLGPSKEQPVRRRRGRPRLAPVPDTAA